VIEFQTDAIAFFDAAEASSHGGLYLAFSMQRIGRQADHDFLSGIVPFLANGSDAAAGQVDHIDLIYHAAFMRIEANASHIHIHRCPRMTPSF